MKIDIFGKIYIALMAVYFNVSGFNALLDIDSKLERIGLSAADSDGKIAFILIYCSLMIGIGISIGLLYFFSKMWEYSAILATVVIASFISFRFVGMSMVGDLSITQLTYIGVEIIEMAIGIFLLAKSGNISQPKASSKNS